MSVYAVSADGKKSWKWKMIQNSGKNSDRQQNVTDWSLGATPHSLLRKHNLLGGDTNLLLGI